jgi:hypothetical protein
MSESSQSFINHHRECCISVLPFPFAALRPSIFFEHSARAPQQGLASAFYLTLYAIRIFAGEG